MARISSLGEDESDTLASRSLVYGRDPSQSLEQFVRDTFSPTGAQHLGGLYRAGQPGTKRIYNNLAFDALGLAEQRIVGESFAQYVDRSIVRPLGMSDSCNALAGRPSDRFGEGCARLQNKGRSYSCQPTNAFSAHRDLKAGIMVHAVRNLSPESVHLISTSSGLRNLDGWMQGLGKNGPLDLRGRQPSH